MFKYLISVQRLTTNRHAKVRTRILTKLEEDSKLTLKVVNEECQRMVNLQHDTARIEGRDISHINLVLPKSIWEKKIL